MPTHLTRPMMACRLRDCGADITDTLAGQAEDITATEGTP